MFDQCLYFNTTALARQLEREWTAAFAPFSLTPPQAFMLRTVLHKPGLLQGELAESMAISRPTATRALDGLALKKLVERRSSERDGREQTIHPTALASELKAALDDASAKITRRLKNRLGTDVFADTVAKVRQIRSALK